MWFIFLQDAWVVLIAAMVLGAGLPILFAFGVKSIAWANGDLPGTPANRIGRVLAAALFSIIVFAVLVGLGYIVAHGLGYTMTFNGLIPTFTHK